MDILESKLMPPRPGDQLFRQRLIKKLSRIEGKRLVLVTAGAGYGKTTLVAQALEKSDMAVVWYRLDEFDRDFTTFSSYLIHGLKKVFPGLDRVKDQSNILASEHMESGLFELAALIDRHVDKETVIVLDDYHLLGPAQQETITPNIHTALDFLLERLAPHVHLVIISRMEPPIKLSTLRVRQQIQEIHEADLAFTLKEITQYFSLVHSMNLSSRVETAIHEKTHGWAASLILLAAALKKDKSRTPHDSILELQGSRHHIFSFLEENIFNFQPSDMQVFMLKTALLDVMDTRLCDQLLGIDNSAEYFKQMIVDHLMVFPFDDKGEVYYYHHLFRDFLQERLKQSHSAIEIQTLHLDIAKQLGKQQTLTALPHFIDAGAYDEAARFLADFELRFLVEGKLHFVRSCLERIPRQIIAKDPNLLFMEAKQYSFMGRPHKAISSLNAACSIFRQTRSNEDVAKCLVDIGFQYYYTGHVPEAKRLMEQVLEQGDSDETTYIMVMTLLIFFCSVLGEVKKAWEYAEQAKFKITQYPEYEQNAAMAAISTSITSIYYFTGEFEKSQNLNQKLVALCKEADINAFLPLAYYHCAVAAYYLGDYDPGIAFAKKGIKVAQAIHLKDSQTGWLYMALAENHFGAGRLDDADQYAKQALDIFQTPGNRWGIACSLDFKAQILLQKGDLAGAWAQVTRALNTINGYGLEMTQSIISLTRARILIRQKNFSDAADLLAKERRGIKHAGFHLCRSWLLDAWCSFSLGQEQNAWQQFKKALAITRKRQYDRLVISQAGQMLPAMAKQGAKTSFNGYIKGLLAAYNTSDSPQLNPSLDIRLLGRFKVIAGNREIPDNAWSRSKSQTIFQYLALHRSQGYIPKEVLIELLWPEEDIARTGKRFNMAMSRLRKILEPDLPPKSPSAYILRKKDQYRLSLGPVGQLDTEKFEAQAKESLNADNPFSRATAEKANLAVSLFTGGLLQDKLYEDWCTRKREDLNTLYCQVLDLLVRFHEAKSNWTESIRFANNYLAQDPYDEAMYQILMALYGKQGQTNRVIETYSMCKIRMKEMDCPVSHATQRLFKRLVPSPKDT